MSLDLKLTGVSYDLKLTGVSYERAFGPKLTGVRGNHDSKLTGVSCNHAKAAEVES